MVYKIESDDRSVEFKEGQFFVKIDQVQISDPSNFISMVESWKGKRENIKKFMETEAKSLEAAKGNVEKQHKVNVEQLKLEDENLQKSLEMFEPHLEKYKTDFPEEYKKNLELFENTIKQKQQPPQPPQKPAEEK